MINIEPLDFGLIQADAIEIIIPAFDVQTGANKLIVHFIEGGDYRKNNNVDGTKSILGHEMGIPENLREYVTSDPSQIEDYVLTNIGATRA